MKKEDFIYAASVLCSKWINRWKKPLEMEYTNILIIKLDEIGDMVNAVHVFKLLQESYPKAKQTLWCKPFLKPLLENDPAIHRIVTTKDELENYYDLIIDLRGSFESIAYAFFHQPKYRVDRGSVRLHNKLNGGQLHEVFTNRQIVAPLLKMEITKPILQLYYSEDDQQLVNNFLIENDIQKFAILHTEARRVLRKWNPEKFASIANYLIEKYSLKIIFAGEKSDVESIKKIQELVKEKTFNTSHFSLSSFAALASKASLFLGNESGPLHIATATQCKSIGLFGPGVPVIFYPWSDNARYIHHVLECNPCDQIHCVHPTNTCMNRISELEVKQKIDELLA